MPIVVNALNKQDFEQWLLQQKQEKNQQLNAQKQALKTQQSTAQLMQLGEEVYNKACAACHQVDGAGLPGIFPAITQSPISLGDIESHINIVVNGQKGTAMQAFVNQLNASEIAAVITYERNALGNAVGDQLQASDIQKFIEGQQ